MFWPITISRLSSVRDADWRTLMKKIEYVFCMGTGRNGSEYLRSVLSHAANAVAEHEPVPRCNRVAMRDYLDGRPERMKALMPLKVEKIMQAKGVHDVYIETNHCFIKGFGWLLPEYLGPERMAVLVLTRAPEKVRESFLRIGATCLSESGRNWQILPIRRNPCIPPPSGVLGVKGTYWLMRFCALPFRHKKFFKQLGIPRPASLPDFLLSYERACLDWYIEETSALAARYKAAFPEITYVSVTIEELNDPVFVRSLFEKLGLEVKESLFNQVGVPTNLKR